MANPIKENTLKTIKCSGENCSVMVRSRRRDFTPLCKGCMEKYYEKKYLKKEKVSTPHTKAKRIQKELSDAVKDYQISGISFFNRLILPEHEKERIKRINSKSFV